MNKKKSNNVGSVYYNKQRNNWIASYSVIDKETSKEKRIRKSFSSQEEAERYLRIIQYQKGNEIFIKNNSIPIYELMKLIHNQKLERNQIGKVAYNRLQSTLNIINKSDVAHKDINDITTQELQEYFNTLTYYSNSYITKIIEQFSQAFRYAMNKGFLLANPMYGTFIPKSTKPDKVIRALNIDEQKKLTDYLMDSSTDDEPYKTAFLIEMYMGLRIGEVLSLKKENVDLKHNLIYVEHTMTRDENGKRIIGKSTKTKAGFREIPIPKNIKKEIKDQLKLAKVHKEGLLFVSNAGTYADPINANHVLKRICKSLDIHNVSTHSLRHTFATRCIEAGMRAVALQRLMGHSTVAITLDTYTSIFNRYKNSELEKVNNYYLNNEIFTNSQQLLENSQTLAFLALNDEHQTDFETER